MSIVAKMMSNSNDKQSQSRHDAPISTFNPSYARAEVAVSRSILRLTPRELKMWIIIRFQEITPLLPDNEQWCVLSHQTIADLFGYKHRQQAQGVISDLVLNGWLQERKIGLGVRMAYRTRVPT